VRTVLLPAVPRCALCCYLPYHGAHCVVTCRTTVRTVLLPAVPRFASHHSFRILPYNRSRAPHKASSPEMPSSASALKFHYLHLSLGSSSSCVRRLSRLPVSSLFPSIMGFRKQFPRKMWPIQLAFPLFIACSILGPPSLHVPATSSFLTRSIQQIFYILRQLHISQHFKHLRLNFLSIYLFTFRQSIQV
jgi:hypothetical protein